MIERYPDADEVVWLQEEPLNMGAWDFFRPCFEELLDDRLPVRYLGRPRSASPSEGSLGWHMINQKMLVAEAYAPTAPAPRAAAGSRQRHRAHMAAQVVVPQLGESVVEAPSRAGSRRKATRLPSARPLVELETEKIDLEVNADQAGGACPSGG
jgi:hypothetical protein